MSGSGVQEVLADSADDIKEEKKEEISETNNLGSSWTLLEKEEQDDDHQVIFCQFYSWLSLFNKFTGRIILLSSTHTEWKSFGHWKER